MSKGSIVIMAFLLTGCGNENEQDIDIGCIYLGFAFYPGLFFSSDLQNYVNNYDSEIVLFHFGDNVPWSYLQECPDLSCADQEFKDLMFSLTSYAAAHERIVYLSVSPLCSDRNAPSNDWNNGQPPTDNFADTRLRTLYKLWIEYLVQSFNPDYISQGVEINMYATEHPEDFVNLITLMEEIKQHTENVFGPSIQWEIYKQQIDNGQTLDIPFHGLGQGFAFSTYPHIFDPSDTGEVTPDHYNFEDYGINIVTVLCL